MANSMNHGWRRSFWGITGQQIALIIQVVIVAVGVGSIVAAFPVVLEVVRWLGAAYLVFLGVRMMLSRPTPAPSVEHAELDTSQIPVVSGPDDEGRAGGRTVGERQESAWAMIRRGILVNLSNPKAIVLPNRVLTQSWGSSSPRFRASQGMETPPDCVTSLGAFAAA